ncbi:GMP synthase (glutamine-hydrolyzing) [Flavobacteriaceae bacterium UJ101]|nr:GMP synthase (glutamine-hydrolyzing) [Flavobacteriaceae bacterium UJ101]
MNNHLKIHCLQHVSYEPLGSIENWIYKNQHTLTYTRFYENDSLPQIDEFDCLIVMGGPMNIYDEIQYPWLKKEKEIIYQAILVNKIVIGICLGAQLIASTLGAKIKKNTHTEIGWYPISKSSVASNLNLIQDIPNDFTTFHWHGDTFELPKDSIPLFQSKACLNQAFLYKEHVLGLQFHMEVNQETMLDMVKEGQEELKEDLFVQSAEEIIAKNHFIQTNNQYLYSILDRLTV